MNVELEYMIQMQKDSAECGMFGRYVVEGR